MDPPTIKRRNQKSWGSKTTKALKKRGRRPSFPKAGGEERPMLSLRARAHLPPHPNILAASTGPLPNYKIPARSSPRSPPDHHTHPLAEQSPCLPRRLLLPTRSTERASNSASSSPRVSFDAAPPRARLVQIGTRRPRRRDGSRLAPSESEPAQR